MSLRSVAGFSSAPRAPPFPRLPLPPRHASLLASPLSSLRALTDVLLSPLRNYCGEFDNAGAMMSVDETLLCSFQILKPAEKKKTFTYGGSNQGRPVTPPRKAKSKKGGAPA